jgi:hypothetical protein
MFHDMRIVKKALQAAGYQLKYSRKAVGPGYYLDQQPRVSAELAEIVAHSAAEVDPAQIRIWRQMPPSERFRLGSSITEDVDVVANIPLEAIPALSRELEKQDMPVLVDIILDTFTEERIDLPINAIHAKSGFKADLYPLRPGDELRKNCSTGFRRLLERPRSTRPFLLYREIA